MPDHDPPKLTLVKHERYLEALIGSSTVNNQEVLRQLEDLVAQVAERKPERLLLDFRAASLTVWTTLDRYALGVLGGRLAAHVARAVCLAPAELIDPQKFGMQVAQNRGLKVEIFSDEVEALRWLLEA